VSEWDLRLGDCLAEGGLASLPDASVDHVICDPPYESEAHTLQRQVKSGDGRQILSKPISFAAIDEGTRAAFAGHAGRVARRWVIAFCQAEAVAPWRQALVYGGLTYKRSAIWVKRDAQPQLSGDRPAMGYESIVLAHTPGRSRWNGGGKTGLYDFLRNQYCGQREHYHETEKPLGLMEQLIADFTDPGELVCDPFAGSGTTGVACIRLGRASSGGRKIRATTKPPVSGWERPASNTNYSLVVPSPANPSSA
jgi:site-specific DNA-methyltransferase (adenine-specific)